MAGRGTHARGGASRQSGKAAVQPPQQFSAPPSWPCFASSKPVQAYQLPVCQPTCASCPRVCRPRRCGWSSAAAHPLMTAQRQRWPWLLLLLLLMLHQLPAQLRQAAGAVDAASDVWPQPPAACAAHRWSPHAWTAALPRARTAAPLAASPSACRAHHLRWAIDQSKSGDGHHGATVA